MLSSNQLVMVLQLLLKGATVLGGEIQLGTNRHDAGGVDLAVATVVGAFDVVEIADIADPWDLINIADIGPQVWIMAAPVFETQRIGTVSTGLRPLHPQERTYCAAARRVRF